MLTRLQVSGFKNLVDVDVRFGPFTCVAGPNGAGKSNLFDAIHFLGLLADMPLLEAAMRVRAEEGRLGDIRNLFHRVGDRCDTRMDFAAEMIVPARGRDELGQEAEATATFLRYTLSLAYSDQPQPGLEVLKEKLVHVMKGDLPQHLLFRHAVDSWRKSAVIVKRRAAPFISTEGSGRDRVIQIHQDGGGRGGPIKRSGTSLTRTVLSAANAAEAPTVTLAKKEMKSWRLLQLEPSALRQPDSFVSPSLLGPDGANLAATVYRLAHSAGDGEPLAQGHAERAYAEVAARLSELIDEVKQVAVDRDEKRELLTLKVADRHGTPYPAMVLSDGTLRFLALAVLELDPLFQGVICLEEPENGIHPGRVPAMLRLLQDIAVDTGKPVGPDNPLRQVIVNTHSPAVVAQVPEDSLLVAELREAVRDRERFMRAVFLPLSETWRAKGASPGESVAKGRLLAYLNPVAGVSDEEETARPRGSRRVADRPDLRPWLPGIGGVK